MQIAQAIEITNLQKQCIDSIIIPHILNWESLDNTEGFEVQTTVTDETCCKLDSTGKVIIYLSATSVSIRNDMLLAACTRSGTEIIEREYFPKLSFYNILAQTCLHEIAHAVTFINQSVDPKNLHNDAFYRVLYKLHSSVISQDFCRCLWSSLESAKVYDKFSNGYACYPKTLIAKNKSLSVTGDVCFYHKNTVVCGHIDSISGNVVTIVSAGRSYKIIRYGFL